jgi:serine/threonine-protein kinase
LALPDFRVPAPQNSAQHLSAQMHRGSEGQNAATETVRPAQQRRHTKALTRGPDDWQNDESQTESHGAAAQFAGIDMDEFHWARQRAKRALFFWVVAVLVLTGSLAAAAWTIGSNLSGLI